MVRDWNPWPATDREPQYLFSIYGTENWDDWLDWWQAAPHRAPAFESTPHLFSLMGFQTER